MAYHRNHNTPWSGSEVAQLRTLACENTPRRVLSMKLGRSERAIRDRATTEGISLKFTNQTPYGKRR